jgi:hypothetical protein
MENEADDGFGFAERDGCEVAEKEKGHGIDVDVDAHSDFDSYAAVSETFRYPPKQKHAEMPFRRTSRLWLDILAALTLGTLDIMVRLVMWIFKR